MRRAFVSHSTVDDRYVAEMESFLRAAGFDDVFNDASAIQPDEQFWPAIEKGIADADTLVVVITAASNASEWVKREVEYARSLSKNVIPVWIEECPVPAFFAGRDVIDFRPRIRQERRIDIGRIIKYAPEKLIGREAETAILNDVWQKVLRIEKGRTHVLTFVALGGEGKTSLVAKWAAELAHQDWPGCDAAFAWSFYSQGSRDQAAVSSDLFLAEALKFFGDAAMAASAQGAFDKGRRLAQLVGERRALLVLDGLEPLQYPPGPPLDGKLKDEGVAELLKGLAASSRGLCVVTTRYSIPNLKAFLHKTVHEIPLPRLSREAGVALLQSFEVKGSVLRNIPSPDGRELWNEFENLVEDVKGHALTLNLLGSYLRDAHGGDIRRRDLVKLEEADTEEQGGHAFRVLDAYVTSFENGGPTAEDRAKGRRALALLRLMGLFDRPASADCLQVLWTGEAIAGLTEPLVGLNEAQRNLSLKRLEDAKLLTVNRDASGTLVSLDAHPLIREYFAKRLRAPTGRNMPAQGNALGSGNRNSDSPEGATQAANVSPLRGSGFEGISVPGALPQADLSRPVGAETNLETNNACRAAHRRLYEHLCETTEDKPDAMLEALQPLYQAVAHGCQAGLHQEACEKVYHDRILRREGYHSLHKLGAFGSDLGAVACFFETPWSHVSQALMEGYQAKLLAIAAYNLRALGRLTEALEPRRAALKMRIKQNNWTDAAKSACNLSELELTLGELAGAVEDAEQSVTYADRSGDAFERVSDRTTHAGALHQAGRRAEAEARFREAEQMQAERQPDYPLLYSLGGFEYCDLLLTEAERTAWQTTLECGGSTPLSDVAERLSFTSPLSSESANAGAVESQKAKESGSAASQSGVEPPYPKGLRAVSQRAATTLDWAVNHFHFGFLSIALDHLTLGRAAFYEAILQESEISNLKSQIEMAVAGLRRAGAQEFIVRSLLTRAWLRSLTSARTGPESAQADLDEAWEIAERGPMPLFIADIHLYRARLFGRPAVGERGSVGRPATMGDQRSAVSDQEYPWESVEHDLAEARRLIEKHGYWRRKEELEDAEAALLGTPVGGATGLL